MKNDVLAAFDQVTPSLCRCDNGGWLALAPDASPVHFGVFAWSADEAQNRFFRSRAQWRLLLVDWLRETVPDSSAE